MKTLLTATLALCCVVLLAPVAQAAPRVADKNCSDFKTHKQAQKWFKKHGGSKHSDPYGLDSDHDGKACELLPRLAGRGPNTPPAGPVNCGYLRVEGSVSSSELLVIAFFTHCGRARHLVEQCAQNGHLPRSWTAGPFKTSFPAWRLRRRGTLQQIRFGLEAGGAVPGIHRCIKRY